MNDPRFAESLRLFNDGKFFESHEVMEGLWREAKADPFRDLYKGVIQAAAAIYQMKRGRLEGGRSLYRSAVGYLETYGRSALGLEVGRLVRDMKLFFDSPEGGKGLKSRRPPLCVWR